MVFAVAVVWFAVGVAAAVVMHRRGHDTFAWALLFLVLGPLALPLAVSAERHPVPQPPAPVHDGPLDVLVAHDGSEHASAPLETVLALLGDRVTSVTLAAVVDAEAATTVRGRETVRDTEARLEAAARAVAATTPAPVDTIVLYGEAARVLDRFAADHGYELIVAGSPGGSHRAGARLARSLACGTAVPVLIGPATR